MAEHRKTDVMPGRGSKGQARVTSVMDREQRSITVPQRTLVGTQLVGQHARYSVDAEFDISTGGESELYLCTSIGDPKSTQFMAKVYRDVRNVDLETRARMLTFLQKDAGVMSNLMPIIDHGAVRETVFDIMPFIKEGDLSRQGKFTFTQLREDIIPSLNETLHIIHSAGFIHRDVKPKNLYQHDGRIIVGDFGIASANSSDFNPTSGRGTDGYRAPELGLHSASAKSDYFSLGITVASLYLGEDVFANCTPQYFGHCIVTKNLPMPIAEEDEDLNTLLYGLIAIDPEHRFGYEEVRLWCQNPKSEHLREIRRRGDVYSVPYVLGEDRFSEPVSLSLALAENWPRAREHLYAGKLEDFFDRQNQELAVQANEIVEKLHRNERDVGLFQFLHYLNPAIPLYWKGRKYETPTTIADAMVASLPAVDRDLLELLKAGLISWHINSQEDTQQAAREYLQEISDLELLAQKGHEDFAYYIFLYAFATEEQPYRFAGKSVASPDEIFASLTSDMSSCYSRLTALLTDNSFFGFLSHLGHHDAVIHVVKRFDGNAAEDSSRLLRLLETVCGDKEQVRDFYIRYGPKSYLSWFKDNISLYRFNGSSGREVREEIAGVSLAKSMSLNEIDSGFLTLHRCLGKVQRMFQNNIFLAQAGVYEGFEADGVTADSSEALFLYPFFDAYAPAGFRSFLRREMGSGEGWSDGSNKTYSRSVK